MKVHADRLRSGCHCAHLRNTISDTKCLSAETTPKGLPRLPAPPPFTTATPGSSKYRIFAKIFPLHATNVAHVREVHHRAVADVTTLQPEFLAMAAETFSTNSGSTGGQPYARRKH
ncbi:MAG: hypothetical protein IPH28_08260 [Cytophagaceae bacterium]|nr:hypothetical protein [Cytophagaceae bacterium]